MAPVTLGLVLSSGWLLAQPVVHEPIAMALVLATVGLTWRTRINPLWPIAAGALAGALGGV
jgi:chromate transporter